MTNRIYLTSITTDQEGALWMGTLTGLIRLQGETWERFGREDGLGNGLVTSVFVDQEGSTLGRSGNRGAVSVQPPPGQGARAV